MGPEFREHLVQVTPRLVDDFREGRAAFRDRGHAVLEMLGHPWVGDIRTVDGEGVHQGPPRGRRPDRTAADVLPAEQEVEDFMPRRLRPEAEPLHREEERPLRVQGRRHRVIFDDADLADGEFFVLSEGWKIRHLAVLRQDLPPARFDRRLTDRHELRVPDAKMDLGDGREARGRQRREEAAGDHVVDRCSDSRTALRRCGSRMDGRVIGRVDWPVARLEFRTLEEALDVVLIRGLPQSVENLPDG